MNFTCDICDRSYRSKAALNQHVRDSHTLSFNCNDCNRSFKSGDALNQHLQNAPVHAPSFDCKDCNRSFKSEDALNQHLQSAPAHLPSFDCKDCNRSFKNEDALNQHLQNAPVHAPSFDCKDCNRSFKTEDALNQHLQSAPVHAPSFDCKDCNRSFKSEDALNMHLRDSPAHTSSSTSLSDSVNHNGESFSMYPLLHDEVSSLLWEQNLFFDFHDRDDDYCMKDYDTNIMGRFTCRNPACKSDGWGSHRIAITIRMYHGKRYNARVYHQRCKTCGRLSRPRLDESYAERVAYRIKKWNGVRMKARPKSPLQGPPHQSNLCEGCKHGHCSLGLDLDLDLD